MAHESGALTFLTLLLKFEPGESKTNLAYCYGYEDHYGIFITCGWTIEPPAASEYAVLPDVVDNISPSPCTHVTNELSQ